MMHFDRRCQYWVVQFQTMSQH